MLARFRQRVQVSRPVHLTCIRLMSKRSVPFPLDNPIDYLNTFSRVSLSTLGKTYTSYED